MASGSNPLSQIIMSALQGQTAAGGQGGPMPPPGGAPGGQGSGGDDAASQYSQQVADLKGADPGILLRQLNQIKKLLASMMVQNLERLPNVAGQIAKTIPQIDRIIKEASQAQNVNSAVRNPVGMSVAAPPQISGGM